MSTLREVDVAIVGAGPAGSATAIAMRRLGLEVALLEKGEFPRHKICGDFLTPGSVGRIRSLAPECTKAFDAASPSQLSGMRITFEGHSILSDFPRDRQGWSISRFETDAILAEQAVREGARLYTSLRAERFAPHPDGGQWVDAAFPDGSRLAFKAGLLVEAGGRYGLIARRLGWRHDDRSLRRYALWSHMEGVSGLGTLGEMHVFRGGYVGVAPLDPGGLANVTMVLTPALMAQARGRTREFFTDTLARHPELSLRTREARFVTPLKGLGPLACRSRRLTGTGIALVGDAGGFVDPFTGEGIFVALESARLLSEAVAAGRLDLYQKEYAASFDSKLFLCRLLQRVIARPWLARYVARALAARRDLADRMVGATGSLLPASAVLSPAYVGRVLLAGMIG